MKLGFLITLISAVILSACSGKAADPANGDNVPLAIENATLPFITKNSSNANMQNTNGGSTTVISQYVHVKSIDFGTGYPSIGVINGPPPTSGTPVPSPIYYSMFSHRLDLQRSAVVDISSHQDLYTLNASERSQLNQILSGSVVATLFDLTGNSAWANCPLLAAVPYANLNTDGGDFSLSFNSFCEYDLYKLVTLQPAGLKPFLEALEVKVEGSSGSLVLGVYPLDQIANITFQHSGGLRPPNAPASPKLTINLPLYHSPGPPTQPPPLPGQPIPEVALARMVAVVQLQTDCFNGQRDLTDAEYTQLVANLVSAYLAYDTSMRYMADGGDDWLTVTTGSSTQSYAFIGGDSSHSGKVIVGDALEKQLQDLINSFPTQRNCPIGGAVPN